MQEPVKRTCLVVDDSQVVRKIARKIFEEMGMSVYEAANGDEAVTVCRGAMPGVIMLDWKMPGMGGMEFLKWLRSVPGGEGPKVIFCSVETDKKRIAQVLNAGANEYIIKPFDADIIRDKLLWADAL